MLAFVPAARADEALAAMRAHLLSGEQLPRTGSETVRQLLRCLTDHFQAPCESPAQRFVGLERFCSQTAAVTYQLVGLGHDVAKVLTRLEGHPPLQPGCEDR